MSDTPNNENITLVHCPFCGREPEFILSFDSRTTKYSLQVGCYVCPCKSEAVYFDNKERASDYLDAAAEKWNNRPIEAELERENAELRKQLSDIEEREAACCPEDVSFDALIAALRKQVLRLERENAELRNLLRIADDLIDEYAEVVEHCDNVDEMREQIKAAIEAARLSMR